MKKVDSIINSIPIYLFVILVLGLSLGSIIWDLIFLPYSNPYNIIGILPSQQFNPSTNLVRYLVYISIPSILLLCAYKIKQLRLKYYKTDNFSKMLDENQNEDISLSRLSKWLYYLFIIMIFTTLILDYLLLDLQIIPNFDIFHDGEQLTAANNFLLKNMIWTGTNFIHGGFYDLFSTVVSWNILNHKSIASFRLMVLTLRYITMLSLLGFIVSISSMFKNKILKLFMLQILIFFYIFTPKLQHIERREFAVLFGLLILLLLIRKPSKILYFFAGLSSVLITFNSIDRGAYFTAIIIIFSLVEIIYERFSKKYIFNMLILFFGIIAGWICFYLFIGQNEWNAFLYNSWMFFTTKDYYDSYIYLSPNIEVNFQHTLPLIINSVNLLLFLYLYIVSYSHNKNRKILFVHLLLLLLSIIFFRSALGRSDSYHIKYSSVYIYLCLGYAIAVMFFLMYKGKTLLFSIALLLLLINSTYLIKSEYFDQTKDLRELPNFKSRINTYITTNDTDFFSESFKGSLHELKTELRDESCVFSFTNEPALGYLLNKPTCGSTYVPWFNSPDVLQEKLIFDLESFKPITIVYENIEHTDDFDDITNIDRLQKVNAYILENYTETDSNQKLWKIYKRNK